MTESVTEERDGVDEGVEATLADENAHGGAKAAGSRHRETPEEKEQRVGEERLSQAKLVAESLRHQRGCPDEGKLPGDGESRVEHYPATKPATSNTPEEPLLVIRCSRCGEAEVVSDESEA